MHKLKVEKERLLFYEGKRESITSQQFHPLLISISVPFVSNDKLTHVDNYNTTIFCFAGNDPPPMCPQVMQYDNIELKSFLVSLERDAQNAHASH